MGREPVLGLIARALDRGRSVLLEGPSGFGKSRILEVVAERHPGPVIRSEAAQLAAIDAPRPHGEVPTLVLVDDVDPSDPATAMDLSRAAHPDGVRLVAALTRAPASAPEPTPAGRWCRIAVPPLSRTATARLIAAELGGLPAPELVAAVWHASGGNPGAVIAVVLDAKETGCIEQGCETWELRAPLPVRRLAELVAEDLAALAGEGRSAAELLALHSPLPIRVAAAVLTPAGVRQLERSNVVCFERDTHRRSVALIDARLAEVLRAGMTRERRSELLGWLAEAYDRIDLSDADLAVVASWRLEIGGWSSERFLAAARAARAVNRPVIAARAAERALQLGAGEEARIERAVAQLHLGRTDHAKPGVGRAGPETSSVRLGVLAAYERVMVGGRLDAATRGLATRRGAVADGSAQRDVDAHLAALQALGGRISEADGLLGETDAPSPPTAAGRVALTVGHAIVAADRLGAPSAGQPSDVEAVGHGEPLLPLADDLVRGLRLLTDDELPPQDRVEAAEVELDTALERVRGETAWWLSVVGWLHLRGGDLAAARDRLLAARRVTDDVDPIRLRPLVTADLALIAAAAGATTEAERRLDQVGDDRDTLPRVAARCGIAEALLRAQRDGEDPAVRTALRTGDEAVVRGQLRAGVEAWHLAARLGAGAPARERLEGLAASVDHRDLRLAVDHAAGLDRQDAQQLQSVACELAADGRYLVAAEVAAQATRLDPDPRVGALASGLIAACPEARTPALHGIRPARLSPRRRATAQLAIEGLDGGQIAARLGLSVRTVENHLGHAYRQLGVRGRKELTRVYGLGRGTLVRVG
jgi:DNA-binding CsgD family transcriptional regulator